MGEKKTNRKFLHNSNDHAVLPMSHISANNILLPLLLCFSYADHMCNGLKGFDNDARGILI